MNLSTRVWIYVQSIYFSFRFFPDGYRYLFVIFLLLFLGFRIYSVWVSLLVALVVFLFFLVYVLFVVLLLKCAILLLGFVVHLWTFVVS